MRKKKLSIGISLLICLAMLATPLSAALADPDPTPVPGRPGQGLPDPTKTGSITLQKFSAMVQSDITGTGQAISDVSNLGAKLEGVGFTLYQVRGAKLTALMEDIEFKSDGGSPASPIRDFDEDSLAGYYNAYDPENPHDAVALDGTVGAGQEYKTNVQGIIQWKDLAQGYYVLVETSPKAGYEAAAASIITIPMGMAGENSEWNYDVHVYPKNVYSNGDIVKELTNHASIDYKEFKVGEKPEWAIEVKLNLDKPLFVEPDKYGSFEIYDVLDPRLTLLPDNTKMFARGTGKALELVKDTHYTESTSIYNNADDDKDPDNGKIMVTWALKDAGMKAVQAAKHKTIRVEFTTEVNKSTSAGTPSQEISIVNTASSQQLSAEDDPDPDEEKKIEDDKKPGFDISRLNIRVVEWKKEAELTADETARLKFYLDNPDTIYINEAEFKIATKKDPGVNEFLGRTDESGAPFDPKEDMVVVSDGLLENGKDMGWGAFMGLTEGTEYYIYNIKAPGEYITRKTPVKVTYTGDRNQTVIIELQNINDEDGPMPIEDPTFKLPKTGGIGTILFIAVGAGLLVISLVLFKKSRKEEQEQQ